MLALTRNIGEIICIGDNIRITLIRATDGKARIGISAPRHIPVHRLEVYEKIHGQQKLEEMRKEKRGSIRSEA